jgi:7-carboxy-7-deazaguanine synthase (Cx14CxxC type)
MYAVKEIYYTLQGEGFYTGRAAVFLRFTRCNLWTGRESDRSRAICQFCDTDFVGTDGPGGGNFDTAEALAKTVAVAWKGEAETNGVPPLVVCTGGEPLLQLDKTLVDAFHMLGFLVAVETNGTKLPPPGVDWICCSPKIGAELLLRKGDELKFVFPQLGADPNQFVGLDFKHFYLQPMDGPDREKNTELAMQYCRANPRWRLSLQTHKILGIP